MRKREHANLPGSRSIEITHSPLHVNVNPRSAFPFPFPSPCYFPFPLCPNQALPFLSHRSPTTINSFLPSFPSPSQLSTDLIIPFNSASNIPRHVCSVPGASLTSVSSITIQIYLYRTPLNSLAPCLSLAICGDRGTPLRTYSILHHSILIRSYYPV